jgi:hypothetical protein
MPVCALHRGSEESMIGDEEWMNNAACLGYAKLGHNWWWSPSTGEDSSHRLMRVARALSVCEGCPVQDQCISYGLSLPASEAADVIWGRTYKTDRERANFERQRKLQGLMVSA